MGMKWLRAPNINTSATFGSPWEKGQLSIETFRKNAQIGQVKLQSKILGYWPDGSIKWTGHSGVFSTNNMLQGTIEWEEEAFDSDVATDRYNGIYIKTNSYEAFIPKHGIGNSIIEWLKVDDVLKLKHLTIGTQMEGQTSTFNIDSITLEENGPVKSVVKLAGSFLFANQSVQDFVLRFRFYRELDTFEIVHTLIVKKDLPIEGVFVTGQVPLKGEDWNRHFSFVGDEGVYTEAAQSFISRRHWQGNLMYDQQLAGQTAKLDDSHLEMLRHAKENAIWNNATLFQGNHRSFQMMKQTKKDYTSIDIGYGNRSKGVAAISGEQGGIAIGVEKFWEKAPRELEIQGMTESMTTLTAWLWSPKAQKMSFGHYSERDHMLSAYEGMEEIRSTAVGIANTNTLKMKIFDKPIKKEELYNWANEIANPAKITYEPGDYYRTKVFGIWSLPDYSTKVTSFLEQQMLFLRKFYLQEIEQRDWYGFWNYGDVMHTYDQARHTWRYDLGGYAWQNTELVPNIWLWQDFLRTGDVEAFDLAEAMTKHTSEVDQYHLGEYCGLGSRHNVLHWGCQCKEARISAAGLHRYYYYLTADERTGDLLSEVKDNELRIFDELAPLREFYPETIEEKYPIRVGPDWSALVSNWMTEWERTGNTEYYQRIQTGIDSIAMTKNRLLSGPTYLFNKITKEMEYFGTGNVGGYHMIISFGAPQYWLELAQWLDQEEWNKMLAEFGMFYALPNKEKQEKSNNELADHHFSWPMFATGLMGYAAKYYQDHDLAKQAWNILLNEQLSGVPLPMEETLVQATTWKNIKEMPWISTNVASQWCLNIILCLEMIKKYLPEKI